MTGKVVPAGTMNGGGGSGGGAGVCAFIGFAAWACSCVGICTGACPGAVPGAVDGVVELFCSAGCCGFAAWFGFCAAGAGACWGVALCMEFVFDFPQPVSNS